jgi:hypothetical protein
MDQVFIETVLLIAWSALFNFAFFKWHHLSKHPFWSVARVFAWLLLAWLIPVFAGAYLIPYFSHRHPIKEQVFWWAGLSCAIAYFMKWRMLGNIFK